MKVRIFWILVGNQKTESETREMVSKNELEMNEFMSRVTVKQVAQSSALITENPGVIVTFISVWYED